MNFKQKQNQEMQIKKGSNLAGLYAIIVYLSLIISIIGNVVEMKLFFTVCAEMCYIGMLILYNIQFHIIHRALYSFYEDLICIEDDYSSNNFDIRNKSGLNTSEISEAIDHLYYKFSFSLICWFAHISIISIAFLIKFWRNYFQIPYLIIIIIFILATYIGVYTNRNHIIKIADYRDRIKNTIKRLEEYEIQ